MVFRFPWSVGSICSKRIHSSCVAWTLSLYVFSDLAVDAGRYGECCFYHVASLVVARESSSFELMGAMPSSYIARRKQQMLCGRARCAELFDVRLAPNALTNFRLNQADRGLDVRPLVLALKTRIGPHR